MRQIVPLEAAYLDARHALINQATWPLLLAKARDGRCATDEMSCAPCPCRPHMRLEWADDRYAERRLWLTLGPRGPRPVGTGRIPRHHRRLGSIRQTRGREYLPPVLIPQICCDETKVSWDAGADFNGHLPAAQTTRGC